MLRHHLFRGAVLALVLLASIACGKKETPEQRLERLRYQHEIIPVGTTTLNRDTNPTLMVDLQVVNKGTEPLPELTVLVTVNEPTGAGRLRQRVTLDLTGVRPGVGERRPAMVQGFELGENDEVMVEIEPNLSPDDLHSLSEWSAVAP